MGIGFLEVTKSLTMEQNILSLSVFAQEIAVLVVYEMRACVAKLLYSYHFLIFT